MLRETICLLLVSILCLDSPSSARAAVSEANAAGRTQTPEAADFQKKVQKIPLQSPVQVKLSDGKKLLGKMTEVSDQGLTLKTVTQDKIVDRKITANELKSIKVQSFPEGSQLLTLKQMVLLAPEGGLAKIRLRDNQKLQEVIEDISDEGLALRVRSAGQAQTRTLAFADVQSVSAVTKNSKKAIWILVGSLVAGIIVLVSLASATSG